MNTSGSEEQAKTTRNMAIEMAMDLYINEKDEKRESDAQPAVRAEARKGEAGPSPPPRAPSPSRLLEPCSLASLMQSSIAISLATFPFLMVHILFH